MSTEWKKIYSWSLHIPLRLLSEGNLNKNYKVMELKLTKQVREILQIISYQQCWRPINEWFVVLNWATIYASPNVTRKILFSRHQLIFCFGRRVKFHSKGLYYIKKKKKFRLSLPRSSNEQLAFVFILNLWYCTSMDSFRRALKLINSFFLNIGRKPKNLQTNREVWILIKRNVL